MNKLKAKITDIHSSGGVILVDILVNEYQMSALLIDTREKPFWLKDSNQVLAVFKENEVSIAKNLLGSISTRNKLPCQVIQIERGELICMITMLFNDTILRSAITTRAVDNLELEVGDKVTALIKSNEITLMEL